MTTLRRRIPVSGHGTRIPVRVEDARSGALVANALAGHDGLYRVEVPGGRYRVAEKWGRSFNVVVPEGGGPFDVGVLAGEDPTTGVMAGGDPDPSPDDVASTPEPALADAPENENDEPGEPCNEPDRDTDSGFDAASTRPARRPRDGTSQRERGPWHRVRRGGRIPRDGGRNRSAAS